MKKILVLFLIFALSTSAVNANSLNFANGQIIEDVSTIQSSKESSKHITINLHDGLLFSENEVPQNVFEIPTTDEVYFMEKVFSFKKEKQKDVPAVVHTDGTGRIHFVSQKSNSILYNLIKEFYNLTEIPIILNTSFNTNNVPIVETPRDALSTFYNCGIDVLYMNNIRITK